MTNSALVTGFQTCGLPIYPRELMRRISSTRGIPTPKPPIAAPPMNAMMLNMLCNLQPEKSLGEINPPVVKFAGNAQPLGSLRVVAFKRLQELSGALGCVGALNDGGSVGPLARSGRTITRWADAPCRGAACIRAEGTDFAFRAAPHGGKNAVFFE